MVYMYRCNASYTPFHVHFTHVYIPVTNLAHHYICINRSASLQPGCTPQMYSFDFSKQVHYPHHAQEVGPLFFKTPTGQKDPEQVSFTHHNDHIILQIPN